MDLLVAAVAAVLIFFTLSGFRRGFVKIIISLLSMVLTLWLVSVVTPYISTYLIENTGVYEMVKEKANSAFSEKNGLRDNTIEENQIETIQSYSVPETMKDVLIHNNTVDVYQKLMVTAFEDYISSFLARAVINIMAFICTFVMIMVFLKMTFLSMEIISRIPIIKGINRLAGLLAGFAEGMIIVWIVFLAATIFLGGEIGNRFFSAVDNSLFLTLIYNNNILLHLIYGLI